MQRGRECWTTRTEAWTSHGLCGAARLPRRIRPSPVTNPRRSPGRSSTTPALPAVSATATASQGRGRDGPLVETPRVPCPGRQLQPAPSLPRTRPRLGLPLGGVEALRRQLPAVLEFGFDLARGAAGGGGAFAPGVGGAEVLVEG